MIPPSHFVVRCFLFFGLLNFVFSWWFGLFMLAAPADPYLQFEADGQIRSISSRIHSGGAEWQDLIHPVGSICCYSFYGYSLVNLACKFPDSSERRQFALRELEYLIQQGETAPVNIPLPGLDKLCPPYGVIQAGNANLLRAGYILLGGKSERIIANFHTASQMLSNCYSASASPYLESYPQMRWPVDNCSAVESLRLHDKLFHTTYAVNVIGRWQDWQQQHLDKQSGMMVAQCDEQGKILDVPRGCALSWSLAFMPSMTPEFAASQYKLYRKNWFIPLIGTVGIREWWPGQEIYSKIREGPVVFNIGSAASGLGIAATRANGDGEAWLGLLRGLESVGLPSWNIYGEKSYFGRLFLLGDILALWGKTMHPWELNHPNPPSNDYPKLPLGEFWIPLALAVVIGTGLLAGFFYLLLRPAYSRFFAERSNWTRLHRIMLVMQTLILAGSVLLPGAVWIQFFIVMIVLLVLENWFLMVQQIRHL